MKRIRRTFMVLHPPSTHVVLLSDPDDPNMVVGHKTFPPFLRLDLEWMNTMSMKEQMAAWPEPLLYVFN